MSTMLAGPPGSCCWTGVKHTGTPDGRVEPFGGLNTYIAEPPADVPSTGPHKRVFLFLADVFGPLYVNNKLLQDYFASCGFVVLGPDYFFGTYIQDLPEDSDRFAWIEGKRGPARAAFPVWFDAVKAKYGTEAKYFAAGYCFGAPFVLDLIAERSIIAGAIAHPAFLEESHFEKVSRPLLLSCAEDDPLFPLASRRRAEDILIRNKSRYFIQVFSSVSHGFAVRGDPNVPHERWAKEESARGIKEWFIRSLA